MNPRQRVSQFHEHPKCNLAYPQRYTTGLTSSISNNYIDLILKTLYLRRSHHQCKILVSESKQGNKIVPPLSSVEAIPMLKISGR